MATELRNTGISVIGDIPWGSHFCCFYDTREDLLDILIPYFKTGLENGEFCLWVISNSELLTVPEAISALGTAVPDLDRYLADGNLEIVGHDEWFLRDGILDLHQVANRFKEKLNQALARGCAGMRVNGSPAWLQPNNAGELRQFEEEVDHLFSDLPILASCTYPLPAMGGNQVFDTVQTHQFAIARRRGGWEFVETPELRQAKAEIKRLNEELEQRVIQRTKELAETNEQLREEIIQRQRAVTEDEKKKEILQKIFDHIPVMITFIDKEGRHKLVNWEWERVLGWSMEELPHENFDILSKCYPDPVEHQQARSFIDAATGESADFRTTAKNGRVVDTSWASVKLSDGSTICIGRDITEQKRAETLLHAREQEFRAIVENAPDQIIRYDRNFRRVYVNPAVAKAYGVPAEELIGKPIGSVISDAGFDIKASQVEHVRQCIASVFNTAETVEFELIWPTIKGERHLSVRLFPELDVNGAVINVLGITRDITERKQAEEALRQSEDRLRLVIDTIPIMAWTVCPDGTVDFLNQRWMDFSGLSLEQFVKNPTDPIHPDDVPTVLKHWQASMVVGEAFEDEMRLRRADGEYRRFLVRTAPLKDERDNVIKWYGVSTDVEDLKRAEERLRTTSEQLRAFSARLQSAKEEEDIRIAREIHDEMGCGLASLRWELERFDNSISEAEDWSQREALRARIKVMVKLTDTTIATMRRIAAELRPSVLDDLGLAEAIEWQTEQFEDRTGIISRCDCSVENLDFSPEQATAIFRILQEALTNVLRHAGANAVEVVTRQENGVFLLMVNDNGRGISESQKSGTRSLGLLGMRERAHLIGAEFEIVGVEGKGTLVTLRVPVSDAAKGSGKV